MGVLSTDPALPLRRPAEEIDGKPQDGKRDEEAQDRQNRHAQDQKDESDQREDGADDHVLASFVKAFQIFHASPPEHRRYIGIRRSLCNVFNVTRKSEKSTSRDPAGRKRPHGDPKGT